MMHSSHHGASRSRRDPRTRAFPDPVRYRDSQGRYWTVFERTCADLPASRGPTCLVFECSEVVRRLWSYPDDWRSLDCEALERLSWET